MSSSLPNRPSLDHLRHQARDLQEAFAAGDEPARARVREQLGEVDAEPKLKLAKAQCVIAREYGFPSWRKLREAIAVEPSPDEDDDPLHVWYAGRLLSGTASLGMLQFSLHRRDAKLIVESWGETVTLEELVRVCPDGDSSGNEQKPAPVAEVWERLLTMAGLADPQATKGIIRISLMLHYPYTHWFVSVTRATPNRLDFVLKLDEVETIPPSGKQESTSQRMAALVREGAGGPLSPEKEEILGQIVCHYDRAVHHRMVILEIARLLPSATDNLDTIALCAKLVGCFSNHTDTLVDIARIAATCDQSLSDLSRLAELVVRRPSSAPDMVHLASKLAAAHSDEEMARIGKQTAQLEASAEFATVKEAFDHEWPV